MGKEIGEEWRKGTCSLMSVFRDNPSNPHLWLIIYRRNIPQWYPSGRERMEWEGGKEE
jgi:hypothetical protein